jgi:hypothetical protein
LKTPHLLNLGNPRRAKENLSGILDQAALDRIEDEIGTNAEALYRLGRQHYLFAIRQSHPNWRQRVSRLYYAAYNVSRAIRLFVSGAYSTEVKEHQKFNELPDDFPSKARYANQLAVLREDRNMCDYDHTCRASDLVLGTTQSTSLVKEFIDTARSYLAKKGLKL